MLRAGESRRKGKASGDSPDWFLNHIYRRIPDFAGQINFVYSARSTFSKRLHPSFRNLPE